MRRAITAIFTIAALVAAFMPVAERTVRAQTPEPEIEVSAGVDDANPSIYDTVTFTIKITGVAHVRPGDIELPTLNGLVPAGHSFRVSQTLANGKLTAEFHFSYFMRPTRTGKIVIDPATVTIGDEVHETEPIELNVAQGVPPTPAPPPTPTPTPRPPRQAQAPIQPSFTNDPSYADIEVSRYFVDAEVDKLSPYIGEQIVYSFKMYSSDMSSYAFRPIHRPPDFAGFWNPRRDGERVYYEELDGDEYVVTEKSAALFPTIAGEITIEPGSMIMPPGSTDPRDRNLLSDPVTLNVRPLPDDEPDAFTGAVGRFDIEAEANSDSIDLDGSLELTVSISGAGNFDTLPDPAWPDIPGWRAFENATDYRTAVRDGTITGRKIYRLVLTPDFPGEFDLPPVEYAFFDPEIEEYVTVSTMPISVEVTSEDGFAPQPPQPSLADEEAPVEDIRHIKPPPGSVGVASEPVASSPVYWALWAAPVAAVAALLIWRFVAMRRMAAFEAGSGERLRLGALNRLAALSSDDADETAAALYDYLDAALGRTASAMPLDALAALLRERGATPETADALVETLRELDRTRFTPDEPQDTDEAAPDGESEEAAAQAQEEAAPDEAPTDSRGQVARDAANVAARLERELTR